MHRADLKSLLRVWKSYGKAHPPLLQKHSRRFFEIILQFLGRYPKNPRIKIPFPVRGFMYVGDFHLLHFFGLLFCVSIAGFFLLAAVPFWWKVMLVSSLVLTLIFLFRYFRSCFRIEPYDQWFAFCKMKYLTNLNFILGGFSGLKKYKTFCIEPSF
jgi:magnesium-transporting ATPase (P-type)